jgi:hypothetical protein
MPPHALALALQVVKLFLSSKGSKPTKVWHKCVSLIRCVPAAASKPSPDTIEQVKQVARDWKEMIYKLECPRDLELLGAWGLLYFLISYNIVSMFDTSEIMVSSVWSRVTSRIRTPWSSARVLELPIGSQV